MRKLLLSLLFVSSICVSNAQMSSEMNQALKVYDQAKAYNDMSMVRAAIYDLIVIDSKNETWKDSLAYVYFGAGEYVSAVLVSKDILKKGNKDNILEVKALSEQQLGLAKEALSSYESLFKSTGKSYFLYQVATIQYQLKRYGECEMTINALLNDAKSAEEKVVINLGKQKQETSMVAALYNIKGVMYKDLGQLEEAKKAFGKAAEVDPEFVLPKANLNVIAEEAKKEEAPVVDESTSKDKKKKK